MRRVKQPAEASAYRLSVEEKLDRLEQLVLDLYTARSGTPFGELAARWLKRIAGHRVKVFNEERHVHHLGALAGLREGELTKGAVDEALGALFGAGVLSAATCNKLRSTGRLIIADATANGEWHSANPFQLARRFREPRPIYRTLRLREVALVVAHFPPQHRALVATILLVGLRPGEAFALRKADVDLPNRVLVVRRSHARNETKTGKERTVPIGDELFPILRAAMDRSGCELVFPRPGTNEQRSPNSRLSDRMRAALKRAGIVSGWRFRCRKYSCPFDGELVRERRLALLCPECGAKMWSVGIPKELRFYDLRHSSATLHREARCDPLVIQEMLGHSPRNTTDSTYTHASDEYRLAEVNKLKLGLK